MAHQPPLPVSAATWLSAPGIVCALGIGTPAVEAGLLAGNTDGMQAQKGWLHAGPLTVGAVTDPLPALPASITAHYHTRSNRLLVAAAQQIDGAVQRAIDQYGAHRVGIVLGTSTSGINDNIDHIPADASLATWPPSYDYRRQRLSEPATFLATYLAVSGPSYTLSTACTSSARALLSARRLLQTGMCDAVICGGVDTLCRLTINGFAALEALSAQRCNPFSANRDGINIGEGAALFVMTREPEHVHAVALLGAGASSDAWHMSAPHPQGDGAYMAMQAALRDAALQAPQIDWVNLHGTGTTHNDAMESHAVHRLFPAGVACTATKTMTGHTLGAAGAIEAALSWLVLRPATARPHLPPHLWDGAPDPELPALRFTTAPDATTYLAPRIAMSNSFAFGGSNVSLILGSPP